MTNRERILAIMEKRKADRIPWIPRLQIWYRHHKSAGTLPARYREWSLRDIERDLGMGTPARDAKIFSTRTENVETRVSRSGDEIFTEYITPVGTVSVRHVVVEKLQKAGMSSYQSEHLIKRPEDYEVVEYIIDHTLG